MRYLLKDRPPPVATENHTTAFAAPRAAFVRSPIFSGFILRYHSAHDGPIPRLQLRDLWRFERALLASIDNYPKLRIERNLGDMRVTETAEITYDAFLAIPLSAFRIHFRAGRLMRFRSIVRRSKNLPR
jgi:hypothetical protein